MSSARTANSVTGHRTGRGSARQSRRLTGCLHLDPLLDPQHRTNDINKQLAADKAAFQETAAAADCRGGCEIMMIIIITV